MNILWVKDNKKGHLKQVKALLEEFKKIKSVNISEFQIDKKFLIKLFRHQKLSLQIL